MTSATIPQSYGTAAATTPVEQEVAKVDASAVALPKPRSPVDSRALVILASLASILALWWAQAFVIPLSLGITISYTLNPLVAWLEDTSVLRVIGTVIG